jgi:hypothetical protein
MRRFTQPAGLAPAVTMASRAVLALTLAAVALTACGSNSGSPSGSAGGSAGPVANASPAATVASPSAAPVASALRVASEAPVTATPVPSAPPDAASATPAATPPPATGKPPATPKPTPNPTAAPLEACALLTGAELAVILKVSAVEPRPMPSGGWVASQCAWNGPSSGFFLAVGTAASLKAAGDPAAPTAKAKLAQFKEQGGATAKDVPGIGDGAVMTTAGLATYKGGTYLQFTNLGLTEDQLIKIAKLAITRL